jgi:hypothetical protein
MHDSRRISGGVCGGVARGRHGRMQKHAWRLGKAETARRRRRAACGVRRAEAPVPSVRLPLPPVPVCSQQCSSTCRPRHQTLARHLEPWAEAVIGTMHHAGRTSRKGQRAVVAPLPRRWRRRCRKRRKHLEAGCGAVRGALAAPTPLGADQRSFPPDERRSGAAAPLPPAPRSDPRARLVWTACFAAAGQRRSGARERLPTLRWPHARRGPPVCEQHDDEASLPLSVLFRRRIALLRLSMALALGAPPALRRPVQQLSCIDPGASVRSASSTPSRCAHARRLHAAARGSTAFPCAKRHEAYS